MPFRLSTMRRTGVMLAVLLLQAVAAVYFVIDSLVELVRNPSESHPLTESPVALALVVGVALAAAEMRRTQKRLREQDEALAAARAAFGQVVATQFTRWGLTPAEKAVALLALKGMDVADIGEARSAAAGTVRAQLTRIYAKAGVSGRAQFAAFFVEDLLADGVDSAPLAEVASPGEATP